MRRRAMEVFRRLPLRLRRALIHSVTPSYTVGAVAVLRRADGRLALVEQRHSLGWALPGGLLNRGEPSAAALVREVREELGLHLDALTLPVPHAAVNPYARRVDIVYFIDVTSPAPLQSEDEIEVTRSGWFSLEALPELSDPTREILRAVRVL